MCYRKESCIVAGRNHACAIGRIATGRNRACAAGRVDRLVTLSIARLLNMPSSDLREK